MTFGIAYDIGDFPKNPPIIAGKYSIIINHVLLFEDKNDFEIIYEHVCKIDDIDFRFTINSNLEKSIQDFERFSNRKRESFSSDLIDFLNQNFEVHIFKGAVLDNLIMGYDRTYEEEQDQRG